jgi:hypothetical protein
MKNGKIPIKEKQLQQQQQQEIFYNINLLK